MQNPILSMLSNPATPNPLGNIKNMMNLIRNAGNPQQMLQSVAQNNPQMQQVLSLVQSSNMTPKDLFYKMAQQRGIDPNQIINMLK